MNNFCTYCTYSIKLQIKWIFNKVIKNNIAQTLTQLIQYILFIKKKKNRVKIVTIKIFNWLLPITWFIYIYYNLNFQH